MPRDEVRIVVLLEDNAHRSFMVRLTERLALKEVRFRRCGNDQEVLRWFDIEMAATRPRMAHQPNLGLVVVLDADGHGVQGRHRMLSDALAAAGRPPRGNAERIAYLVPARHIETWYLHLCVPAARPVDESADYKNSPEWRTLARDVGRAARQAVQAWDPESGRVDPDSMNLARDELRRVL